MSRWDDTSFDTDRYDPASDNEEVRLLKKFEGYKELEKLELEKRNDIQIVKTKKSGFFARFFHAIAVIQGIIITGFTISLILLEFISSDIRLFILSLITVMLSGEIVVTSIYLRKKLNSDVQKNSSAQTKNKTEFARI